MRWPSRIAALITAGLAACAANAAETIHLDGVTTSYAQGTWGTNAGMLGFKTATEDVSIDLNRVSPEVRARLLAPGARKEIQGVDIDPAAIASRTPVPMGIRDDCSELPLSIDRLDSIARSATNPVQFLQSIPAGTLQTFTFVTNSLSVQRGEKDGKVTPEWPRVLRTSADGKLTISYVCNPASEAYGKIEVQYWDDATGSFKMREYNTLINVPPAQRVHADPGTCAKCHAPTSIGGKPSYKPNWPEYFFWGDCQRDRGITLYGASDDNMEPDAFRERAPSTPDKAPQGCTRDKDKQAHLDEVADYRKFRETQKDNPCYSSLPWPKIPAGKEDVLPYSNYKNFPYAKDSQVVDAQGHQNYRVRTNLRFNDMYSHLMAKRIAKVVRDSPDYMRVKYYLAMEAAGCLTSQDRQALKNLVPGLATESAPPSYDRAWSEDPRNSESNLLYAFGKRAGLAPEDWSMEYNRPGDPVYRAAMPREMYQPDSSISDGAQGEILAGLAQEDPKVAAASQGAYTRGVTQLFGQDFSCIDDLGGAVSEQFKDRQYEKNAKLCATLRKQNEDWQKFLDQAGINCPKSSSDPSPAAQAQQRPIQAIAGKLDEQSARRGAALAQPDGKGRCVKCHAPTDANKLAMPRDLLFLPDPARPETRGPAVGLLRQRLRDGLLDTIRGRLERDKDMPPTGNENLSSQDKEDILSYFQSLAN